MPSCPIFDVIGVVNKVFPSEQHQNQCWFLTRNLINDNDILLTLYPDAYTDLIMQDSLHGLDWLWHPHHRIDSGLVYN